MPKMRRTSCVPKSSLLHRLCFLVVFVPLVWHAMGERQSNLQEVREGYFTDGGTVTPEGRSMMNVHFHSQDWRERILSNLAHTPFNITINGESFHCNSVEGFWQGLKCKGEMRKHVFLLSGTGAKRAGAGKRHPTFEIAGCTYRVGSKEHADLIREATKQKILQNPTARQALKESKGLLTHQVGGDQKPIFKMERFLREIYRNLFGNKPKDDH